jgi:uncharacterized protein DUF2806
MYPGDLAMKCFGDPNDTEFALIGGTYLIHVKRGKIPGLLNVPIWKFTDVGRELLGLVRTERDDEYLEKVGRFFVTRGGEAVIGTIKERSSDGKIMYKPEKHVQKDESIPALAENTSSALSAN